MSYKRTGQFYITNFYILQFNYTQHAKQTGVTCCNGLDISNQLDLKETFNNKEVAHKIITKMLLIFIFLLVFSFLSPVFNLKFSLLF